jgi:hypothetical protein
VRLDDSDAWTMDLNAAGSCDGGGVTWYYGRGDTLSRVGRTQVLSMYKRHDTTLNATSKR